MTESSSKCPGPQLELFVNPSPCNPPPEDPPTSLTRLQKAVEEIDKKRRRFSNKEEYYESPEWRAKRRQKLESVGYKCERCGTNWRLQVHHLSYIHLYNEPLDDLEAVCERCHPSADREREYDSALETYGRSKYGDDVCYMEPSDIAREFDEWLEWQGDGY